LRRRQSSLLCLPTSLILLSGNELDHLLDVAIYQVNAQHLAGVGPHPDDEIYAGDTINNQIAAVVASDR
jgi:hypothetical protein